MKKFFLMVFLSVFSCGCMILPALPSRYRPNEIKTSSYPAYRLHQGSQETKTTSVTLLYDVQNNRTIKSLSIDTHGVSLGSFRENIRNELEKLGIEVSDQVNTSDTIVTLNKIRDYEGDSPPIFCGLIFACSSYFKINIDVTYNNLNTQFLKHYMVAQRLLWDEFSDYESGQLYSVGTMQNTLAIKVAEDIKHFLNNEAF